MLDAAFDKSAFPSFGSNQPNTYLKLLDQARQNHGDQLSVTMAEMQASLSARPDVSSRPFEVRLVRPSTVVNATGANIQRLHQALDAAKHALGRAADGAVPEVRPCALSPRVLNGVPHPQLQPAAPPGLQRCSGPPGAAATRRLARQYRADGAGRDSRTHRLRAAAPGFARLLAISAEAAGASARELSTKAHYRVGAVDLKFSSWKWTFRVTVLTMSRDRSKASGDVGRRGEGHATDHLARN